MSIDVQSLVSTALETKPLVEEPSTSLNKRVATALVPEENFNTTNTLDKAGLQTLATHMADTAGKLPGTDLKFLTELYANVTKLLRGFSKEREEFDTVRKAQTYRDRLTAIEAKYRTALIEATTSGDFELKLIGFNGTKRTVEMTLADGTNLTLDLQMNLHAAAEKGENAGKYELTVEYQAPPLNPDEDGFTNGLELSSEQTANLEAALLKKDSSILSIDSDLSATEEAKTYCYFLRGIDNHIRNRGNWLMHEAKLPQDDPLVARLLEYFMYQTEQIASDNRNGKLEAFKTYLEKGQFFRTHRGPFMEEEGIQALDLESLLNNESFTKQFPLTNESISQLKQVYQGFRDVIAGLEVHNNFQPYLDDLVGKIDAQANKVDELVTIYQSDAAMNPVKA